MKPIKHKRHLTRLSITLFLVVLLGIFITIAVIWTFINVKDQTGTSNVLQLIVSLVAIISGVSGVIIGLSSLRSAQLGSINDYFTSGDTKEFKHAWGILYTYALQYSNNGISVFNNDFKLQHHDIDKKPIVLYKDDVISTISYISNFFHQWGLLTKHRYLPLWVFQSSSGISVYRLYNASREVIDTYRKTSNPFYGEYFEWLYLKVYKTYKDEIHSYLELNKEK